MKKVESGLSELEQSKEEVCLKESEEKAKFETFSQEFEDNEEDGLQYETILSQFERKQSNSLKRVIAPVKDQSGTKKILKRK